MRSTVAFAYLAAASCSSSTPAPLLPDATSAEPVAPLPVAPCEWNAMQPLVATAFAGHAYAIGDITGDGISDWVEREPGGRVYRLFAGPWPGVAWASFETAEAPLSIRWFTGDLNADGFGDVAVARFWTANVDVWFGPIARDAQLALETPDLALSSTHEGASDMFGSAVLIADVTGDGNQDLVVGAPGEGEEACAATKDIAVWPGPLARGTAVREDAPLAIPAAPFTCLGLQIEIGKAHDQPELFVAGHGSGQWFALPLAAAPQPARTIEHVGYGAASADADGDGVDDLVLERGAIKLASGGTAGIASGSNAFAGTLDGWSSRGLAFVFDPSQALRLLVPDATELTQLPVLAPTVAISRDLSVGDIDSNGRADITVGTHWLACP